MVDPTREEGEDEAPIAATWEQLAPVFARGDLVYVATDLDLMDVAAAFAADDRDRVAAWMAAGAIAVVRDAQALVWAGQPELGFRFVIRQPFVLAQPVVS